MTKRVHDVLELAVVHIRPRHVKGRQQRPRGRQVLHEGVHGHRVTGVRVRVRVRVRIVVVVVVVVSFDA